MQLALTAGICAIFLSVDEVRTWVTDPAKYVTATPPFLPWHPPS